MLASLRLIFILAITSPFSGLNGLSYSQTALAVQDEQPVWRTGSELERHLKSPISVAFSELPLRSRIYEFSHQQRVAIFVDRRLDPNTPLTLMLHDVTTEQMLWALAEQQKCGVCRLDDFYYIGPAKTTATLAILWPKLADETGNLTRTTKAGWNRTLKFELPEFEVPNEVLSQLGDDYRFEIVGEGLPHDIWPSIALPPMTIDKYVALLAVGFGKWYERSADGNQIRLIDFPMIESGKIDFGVVENGKTFAAELKKQLPDCKLTLRGKSLTATGAPLQLAIIRGEIIKSQRPLAARNDDQRRYTLTTRASRGSILATIANQTSKKLEYDPALRVMLNETIELSLNEVSLTQLLEETLAGTETGFELQNDQLLIFKK